MYEAILEAIENLNDADLLKMWNEYASDECMDDYIFGSIEELAELFSGDSLVEFARRIIYGEVDNIQAPYWWVNGYANIESSWGIDDTPIDTNALAAWIVDNPTKIVDYDLDVGEEEEEEEEEE